MIATRLLTWQAAACALQAAVRCAADSNKPGCVAAARALQAAARARCSAAALRRGGGKGADVDGRYACTSSPVDVACCGGWAVENRAAGAMASLRWADPDERGVFSLDCAMLLVGPHALYTRAGGLLDARSRRGRAAPAHTG